MPAIQPRYTPEELAQIGAEAFERLVRPSVRPEDDGKFVAIDVASGDFEISEDDYSAVTRLRGRSPASEIWLGRIGDTTAYRIGRRA